MRRIGFVIVALALVLSFGACKKENVSEVIGTLVFPVSADAKAGSKAVVTPEGEVLFTSCDYLYLAYKGSNNNSCLSKGTGGNTVFSGTMKVLSTIDVTNDVPLHFFGLAGVTGSGVQDAFWTEKQLSTGVIPTRTCISLQNLGKNSDGIGNKYTRSMPYLCFGVSKENFPTDDGKYTVDLKNKCAMVKYNVAGITYDKEIYIQGLNNVVAVDFRVPYYFYMSEKDEDMRREYESSRAAGYDDDGFMFVQDNGIIQKKDLLTPGAEKILIEDGTSDLKVRDIIIPYRDKPETETDFTCCYSLLLPQTGGLETLSGYYFDDEGNKVGLTIKIIDWEGKPATQVLENWYYEINITTKEDS